MHTTFQRLVRFENTTGAVYFGEAPSIQDPVKFVGQKVPVYTGGDPWGADFKLSGKTEEIAKVLSPLASVPIFHCVGLNYKLHIEEAKFPTPKFPSMFSKPPDALAGPLEEIPISKECYQVDYEAELSVIIGKDCKNLGDEDPMDYVLGYTVGNDVSSRYWQAPERCGSQVGYAKSFEKFAPLGPVICSTGYLSNLESLTMTTKVNGELRQKTKLDDLLFDVGALLRHQSRGRTLRKGTVFMTGTPSGVGLFMKPPSWIQSGDVVEIEIERLGLIRNKFIDEVDVLQSSL